MDKIKFYRRRQFALGPAYFDFPGWTRVELSADCLLTAHPDLPVTTARGEGRAMTLLGFVIDPFAPDKKEEQLLKEWVGELRDLASVTTRLEKLSGRFVLIVQLGEQRWLFHDAVALRQVQYCRDAQGRVWCASQAETLAERHGFVLDPEVVSYKNLPVFEKAEFWFLNDRTPYREVLNLIPNHYLDLRSGRATRYWPTPGCVRSLSLGESIRLCTPILVNSIKAAAERFDLRMGMSAGIDSRKTLAASRSVSGRIYYFSHGITEGTMDFNDAKIPASLLPRLNLKHHALPMQPMSNEFRQLYEQSSTWAREKKGKIAYTLFREFGPESTVLNSNISEVAQCIYWLPKSMITGEGLALLCGLAHPFALREFQKWLDGAKDACAAAGMDVLALFFLEQRMGRWATAAFAEYDIAHETFNPYNNRYLHCLMLGVPERHRRDRMWDVSLKHIKLMWPEVLMEPINPQDRVPAKIQQFIRRFVVHKTIASWWSLYPYLRYRKKERRFRDQQRRLAEAAGLARAGQ